MKALKKIIWSLLITIFIFGGFMVIQYLIDNHRIDKVTNKHFHNRDCIVAGLYLEKVIGAIAATDIFVVKRIDNKIFRIESHNLAYHIDKTKNEKYYYIREIEDANRAIFENEVHKQFENCSRDNLELKYCMYLSNYFLIHTYMYNSEIENIYNLRLHKLETKEKVSISTDNFELSYWIAEHSGSKFYSEIVIDKRRILILTAIIVPSLWIVIFTLMITIQYIKKRYS